jgi:VPDSG-CTERM motif
MEGSSDMEKVMNGVAGNLRRLIFPALAVGALVLASVPSANARQSGRSSQRGQVGAVQNVVGPRITISDGKKKDTITLADPSGLISYSGNVGKFTLSISTTPASGAALLPSFSVNSLSYSASGKKGGTLTISISDTSVNPTAGSIASQISGQTSGTVSYSTFADTSNSLFGKGTVLSNQGTLNGAFNSTGSATLSSQAPFSLTELFVIHQGRGGNTAFGATVVDPPVGGGVGVAVPDVGSTLALFGLALLGVEIVRRKLAAA